MAGIDNGFIWHCEQFGTDSRHERLIIAVREISAAIAALEYDIARKYALLLLVPEYHAAW